MTKQKTTIPQCCAEMRVRPVVYLWIPLYKPSRPATWQSIDCNKENGLEDPESHPSVNFCAYCGERLPRFQKMEDPGPVRTCTDGGFYCNTCGERLRKCECDPASAAYELVEWDVETPGAQEVLAKEVSKA